MEKSRIQIVMAVLMALLLVIGGSICVVFVNYSRIPELSQKKMQDNMTAAESIANMENGNMSDELMENDGERYSKELESFAVDGSQAAGNTGKNEVQGEQEKQESGYLCVYTSERLITEEDLAQLKAGSYDNLPAGKNIVQMVINEMYAKYGYQFQNEEIQSYFDQKEWYQGITERSADMNEIFKNMTETEKANVEFLSEHNVEG